MKFSCEKAILNDAIGKTLRAVSTKSNITALEGILFDANNRLTLTGFDLEIGIRTICDADIIEKGGVILNAQLISSIVRKLPDNIITISTDENHYATISCSLADLRRNHCECEECQKKRPSDWYMMILNEVDEMMTKKGLSTIIQLSAYVDIMFAPETERFL